MVFSGNIIELTLLIIVIVFIVYYFFNLKPRPKYHRPKSKKRVRFNDNVVYHEITNDNLSDNNLSDDSLSSEPDWEEDERWDTSFGVPLIKSSEKKEYFAKMQQNHKKFERSLNQYTKFLTNRDSVIDTNSSIDIFRNDRRKKRLMGKTIQEVYDDQTRGYVPRKKKIKRRTKDGIQYCDESVLNGGRMGESNLTGWDQVETNFKKFDFGNEF